MQVLITGGSGWMGRAVMRFWPENQYIVYSRSESAQAKCRERYPLAEYVLGDIRDRERLELTLREFDVDVVIHAAGMKRVDDCERNAWEAVEVNVDGSRSVARACLAVGVQQAVAISTDKAVQPTGVYGMTKALMERLWVEMAERCAGGLPRFVVVRNGNFVGSTGSVIELWQRQLAATGRITLTDPDMTRFWQSASFTVSSLRELIEHPQWRGHLAHWQPQAMRMGDLAAMLAGDAVDIVGARPGERLHEKMAENGILSSEVDSIDPSEMKAWIEEAALV